MAAERSRRDLLRAGAATAGTVGLAGCLSDPDDRAVEAADEWVHGRSSRYFAERITSSLSTVAPLARLVEDPVADFLADRFERITWNRLGRSSTVGTRDGVRWVRYGWGIEDPLSVTAFIKVYVRVPFRLVVGPPTRVTEVALVYVSVNDRALLDWGDGDVTLYG